jgi:transposase
MREECSMAKRKALTTGEREGGSELRKRDKRVEVERDILKKAAAFFAKETT